MRVSCVGWPACVQPPIVAILAAQRRATEPSARRCVSWPANLQGTILLGLRACAVEVEDELEARREATVPVAGQSRPLVPDVPGEAPPALAAHPVEPAVPVRDDFVVAVDQPEVDQHLAVGGHRQLREHAAHQGVPIGDAAGGVVALVAVGRRGEAQRARSPAISAATTVGVGGVAADQAMRAQRQTSPGRDTGFDRRIRHVVSGVRFIVVLLVAGSVASPHRCASSCLDLGIVEAGQRQVVTRPRTTRPVPAPAVPRPSRRRAPGGCRRSRRRASALGDRCASSMTGTSASPNLRAAARRPWPAMMPLLAVHQDRDWSSRTRRCWRRSWPPARRCACADCGRRGSASRPCGTRR